MKICLVNFSKRPAHRKHIDALKFALNISNIEISDSIYGCDVAYIQTTSLKNILIGVFCLLLRKETFFYYHEPCFLSEKLKKRNSIFYSVAVKLVQSFEVSLFSNILVSHKSLVRKVRRIHPFIFRIFRSKKIYTLPLVICDEFSGSLECKDSPDVGKKSNRLNILFLGRAIPDQRFFWLFDRISKEVSDVDFTLLTKDSVRLSEGSRVKVLSASGYPFSEELRVSALKEADIVWTPYEFRYNQSGVIPDALSFGCALIVSYLERDLRIRNTEFCFTIGKELDLDAFRAWLLNFINSRHDIQVSSRKYFLENHSPLRLLPMINQMKALAG